MNEYAALIFWFFYIKIKKHKKIHNAQTKIKSSSPKKTTYNQNPKAKKRNTCTNKNNRPHRVYEASNDSEQRLSKNKQPFGF